MSVFIEKTSPEWKLEELVNVYRCMKESRSFQNVMKHRLNMAFSKVKK